MIGATRGNTGNSPLHSEMEKIVVEKWCYFRRRFSNNLSNIVTNSICLLHLYREIIEFSQNFPTICIFRLNARKINGGFLNFVEKTAKIMHFLLAS